MYTYDNIFVFGHKDAPSITYQDARIKRYNDVYVMCLKDGETPDGLLEKNLSKEIMDKFVLVKSPLITVKSCDKGLIEVYGKMLLEYFPDTELPDANVLVFPAFLLEISNMKLFKRQFEGVSNFLDVLKLYSINAFMKCDSNRYTDHYVRLDMIKGMIEAKFWMNQYNCGHNINLQFLSRTFNLKDFDKINNDKIKDILTMKFDKNYVLDTRTKKDYFVDPSLSIPKRGYRLYRVTPYQHVDLDSFKSLLRHMMRTNIKEAYFFVNYALVAKEYCHLILRSMDVLYTENIDKRNQSFVSMFMSEFKYCMSYAWLCMYMEECVKKSKCSVNDRFIFTADEASHFPPFPFVETNPHMSPYLPVLINRASIAPTKNVMGIDIMDGYTKNIGVCNTKMFKDRMNLFITGKDIDVFEGMVWSDVGITGSIMAGCLPRWNPLLSLYNGNYVRFFDAYYKDADVDIMIKLQGKSFVDRVFQIKNVIEQNLKKHYPNTEVVATFKKTVTLVVNEDISIDEAYERYLQHMTKYIQEGNIDADGETLHKDEEKYQSLLHIVHKSEVKLIIRKENDKPFLIFNNTKYKIMSEHLARDLELFSVYIAPMGVVTRFYLPIVRAYYDGNQVYMTPSCVSACMTFINIDYRYFAGTKDPIQVVNKYRLRGFGLYLNDAELRRFDQYVKDTPVWKNRYGNVTQYRGYLTIINRFYTLDNNCIVNQPVARYNSIDYHLKYTLNGNYNYPVYFSTAISENGYTTPFKPELIDKFDFSILKQ